MILDYQDRLNLIEITIIVFAQTPLDFSTGRHA
jgi:hypothetical protein